MPQNVAATRGGRLAGLAVLVRAILLRGLGGGSATKRQAKALRRRLRVGLSRARRAVATQRLAHFPGFSAADYMALNPDLRWFVREPAAHALFNGSCTGRPLFRRTALVRVLGELAIQPSPQPRVPPLATVVARSPRLGIYVSSHGNVFMHDIAEDLAAALTAIGIAADLLDETAPITPSFSLRIFVAPHEFFVLGRGPDWVREDVMSSAVLLNTEQVQTRWFAQALPFLLAARAVIDLNAQVCGLLVKAGVPCLHLAPPPAPHRLLPGDRAHPLFRALPSDARCEGYARTPLVKRPLDIAFFGVATPRRNAFFAHHAEFFRRFATFFHCRPAGGPIHAGGDEGALSRLARHVGLHTRIMLNLHHDEFGYFEWHRIVRLGMAAGSIVVSEPCLPYPGIRPGEHYFEETTERIPQMIEWLLLSQEGRRAAEQVQENARRLLEETFSAERTAARLLSFLLDEVGVHDA